jgi:ribosomal protein S27AE
MPPQGKDHVLLVNYDRKLIRQIGPGVVLPAAKFGDLDSSSGWSCGHCGFVTSNDKVRRLLEAVEKGIKSVTER